MQLMQTDPIKYCFALQEVQVVEVEMHVLQAVKSQLWHSFKPLTTVEYRPCSCGQEGSHMLFKSRLRYCGNKQLLQASLLPKQLRHPALHSRQCVPLWNQPSVVQTSQVCFSVATSLSTYSPEAHSVQLDWELKQDWQFPVHMIHWPFFMV